MPSTETHFDLTSNDGVPIEAHRWQGPTQRAVIQLAHGMGEHSLRYRHLAKALVEAGYVVYGNEHRGHGKGAAARDELGEFGPRGFGGLVDDMALLSRHVRGVHPGLPLILLGHSMGSFATQYYLVKHSDLLSGAVLSGTSALDLLGGALQSGFKLEDMNAALPDVRTPFDWLSRDAAQVDAYIADPLCGFTGSAEGMGSMFAHSPRSAALSVHRRPGPGQQQGRVVPSAGAALSRSGSARCVEPRVRRRASRDAERGQSRRGRRRAAGVDCARGYSGEPEEALNSCGDML